MKMGGRCGGGCLGGRGNERVWGGQDQDIVYIYEIIKEYIKDTLKIEKLRY